MPRITASETDKNRLWETIYLLKGEEYLNEKLKYFQDRLEEEKTALDIDTNSPGNEYRDSYFYENQIAQYNESIKIINSIIERNARINRFSPLFIRKMIISTYQKILHGSNIKANLNNDVTIHNKIQPGENAGNKIIDEKILLRNKKTDPAILTKRKIKINFTLFSAAIICPLTFSILFKFIFLLSFAGFMVLLSALVILSLFLISIFNRKKEADKKQRQKNLKVISEKLDCKISGNVINGYYNSHRVDFIRDDNKLVTKIMVSAFSDYNPIAYFTTKENNVKGFKRIITGEPSIDESIKIFSNYDNIRFIFDKNILSMFQVMLSRQKTFEIFLHDNILHYYDYKSKMPLKDEVFYYISAVNLLSEISNKLESL